MVRRSSFLKTGKQGERDGSGARRNTACRAGLPSEGPRSSRQAGCFQPEGPQDRFHLDTTTLLRAGPAVRVADTCSSSHPAPICPSPTRTPLRVKMALSTLPHPSSKGGTQARPVSRLGSPDRARPGNAGASV